MTEDQERRERIAMHVFAAMLGGAKAAKTYLDHKDIESLAMNAIVCANTLVRVSDESAATRESFRKGVRILPNGGAE